MVDGPDLLVLMYVTVKSEHVEKHVNGKDWVTTSMEKACLLFLLLNLVTLEKRRFHVDEIESLLVLSLLCQHFQVQIDKVLINVEVGLFHQFQKKQVCNIEYLSLEAQRQADQIHGLDGPLGVNVLLMHLVKMQTLVLLFEELAFANVRKE